MVDVDALLMNLEDKIDEKDDSTQDMADKFYYYSLIVEQLFLAVLAVF